MIFFTPPLINGTSKIKQLIQALDRNFKIVQILMEKIVILSKM
jgi:hypothetical protein